MESLAIDSMARGAGRDFFPFFFFPEAAASFLLRLSLSASSVTVAQYDATRPAEWNLFFTHCDSRGVTTTP